MFFGRTGEGWQFYKILFLQKVYVRIMCQLKRLELVSRTPVYSYFSEVITGERKHDRFEYLNENSKTQLTICITLFG